MKHIKLLALLCIFTASPVLAQESPEPLRRHSLFVEFGGNGGYYSFNYDRIMLAKPKWKMSARVGAMYYRESLSYLEDGNQNLLTIPVELSYLRGAGNHHLELGLGVTALYEHYQDFEGSDVTQIMCLPAARVGYRYQKRDGGFFFKTGLTPMLQIKDSQYKYNKTQGILWAGIAFGYTLKDQRNRY